jgi:hypothetical protein
MLPKTPCGTLEGLVRGGRDAALAPAFNQPALSASGFDLARRVTSLFSADT